MKTTFQISTPIYWGFRLEFDNSYLDFLTSQHIIKEITSHMKAVFHSLNLEELKEGVDKLNLYIHEPIVRNQVNFVCDHNNS